MGIHTRGEGGEDPLRSCDRLPRSSEHSSCRSSSSRSLTLWILWVPMRQGDAIPAGDPGAAAGMKAAFARIESARSGQRGPVQKPGEASRRRQPSDFPSLLRTCARLSFCSFSSLPRRQRLQHVLCSRVKRAGVLASPRPRLPYVEFQARTFWSFASLYFQPAQLGRGRFDGPRPRSCASHR